MIDKYCIKVLIFTFLGWTCSLSAFAQSYTPDQSPSSSYDIEFPGIVPGNPDENVFIQRIPSTEVEKENFAMFLLCPMVWKHDGSSKQLLLFDVSRVKNTGIYEELSTNDDPVYYIQDEQGMKCVHLFHPAFLSFDPSTAMIFDTDNHASDMITASYILFATAAAWGVASEVSTLVAQALAEKIAQSAVGRVVVGVTAFFSGVGAAIPIDIATSYTLDELDKEINRSMIQTWKGIRDPSWIHRINRSYQENGENYTDYNVVVQDGSELGFYNGHVVTTAETSIYIVATKLRCWFGGRQACIHDEFKPYFHLDTLTGQGEKIMASQGRRYFTLPYKTLSYDRQSYRHDMMEKMSKATDGQSMREFFQKNGHSPW
ncbi:MAG: hypothetical protein R3A11_04620 [Bdellovibrionota bacterium]